MPVKICKTCGREMSKTWFSFSDVRRFPCDFCAKEASRRLESKDQHLRNIELEEAKHQAALEKDSLRHVHEREVKQLELKAAIEAAAEEHMRRAKLADDEYRRKLHLCEKAAEEDKRKADFAHVEHQRKIKLCELAAADHEKKDETARIEHERKKELGQIEHERKKELGQIEHQRKKELGQMDHQTSIDLAKLNLAAVTKKEEEKTKCEIHAKEIERDIQIKQSELEMEKERTKQKQADLEMVQAMSQFNLDDPSVLQMILAQLGIEQNIEKPPSTFSDAPENINSHSHSSLSSLSNGSLFDNVRHSEYRNVVANSGLRPRPWTTLHTTLTRDNH